MLLENSIINCDDEAIETLREIADKTTYRIIIAIGSVETSLHNKAIKAL